MRQTKEKAKKSSRSSRRRKNSKTNKSQETRQTKEKAKKSSNSTLPLKQTTPNTQCKLSTLGRIYHVSSLNHSISKRVLPTLCTFSPPLAMNSSNTNREKHEMLCMRTKLRCFTRYTSRYLSNYTQPLCQDLQKQELILTKRPLNNNHVAKSIYKQDKHI
jgi:hypothetical protein